MRHSDTQIISFQDIKTPHKGHENVYNKHTEIEKKYPEADSIRWLGNGHDNSSEVIEKAFPSNKFIKHADVKNPFHAIQKAYEEGYKHIKVISPHAFAPILQKVADFHNHKPHSFNFDSIEVIPADGETISDYDLRTFAKKKDKEGFKSILHSNLSTKTKNNLYKKYTNNTSVLRESLDVDETPVNDLTHKTRYITLNGKRVKYISRYTQGVQQAFFYEGADGSQFDSTILYPDTVEKTPYKFNREELPQIDGGEFLEQAAKDGIRTFFFNVQPSDLSPIQSEFDEDKVNNIIADPKEGFPPIITRDNFILDGHHRWLAAFNKGNAPLKVTQVNLNADQALKYLKGQEFVQYKTLQEQLEDLFEDKNTLLLLGCIKESIELGLDEESAILNAAWALNEDFEDVKEVLTLSEAYNSILIRHPISIINAAAKKGKSAKITFKNGDTKTISAKVAKAISHIHHQMSSPNRKKIDKMVAHSLPTFEKISTWAQKHADVKLDESVLSETPMKKGDTLIDGSHEGKLVRIKDGEHAGKRGVVVYSTFPHGTHHSVNDFNGRHLGFHQSNNLILDEDEMDVDGGGAMSALGPDLSGPMQGPYTQTG